jgi:hypothetical protein
MSDTRELWASRLVVAATSLFLVGAITGILIPTAGADKAMFGRLLAAHLNAILSCSWLLGIAWTLPRLSLGEGQLRALCVLAIVSSWANWAVTLAKAWLSVAALDWGGGGANGAVWLALVATVVVPTLGAAGLWALGAWKGRVSAG